VNKTIRLLKRQRFALWQAVLFFMLLVALSACNGDRLLGVEVQPEGALDPIQKIDSFTVEARTVLLDEPQNSTRAESFIGTINNDVFGRSSASLYLNFVLESENVTLDLSPEEYVVDDLTLTLNADVAYGTPSESQQFRIKVLDEDLILDSTYNSSKSFRTDDNPVGTTFFSFTDQSQMNSLTNDDSYAGIQISLDKDLGEFLLQGIGREYSTSSQFQEYFKGLFIENSSPSSVQTGAIYNLNTTGSRIELTLNFHPANNDSADARESLTYVTTLSTTRVNHFDHDRTGALVEGSINDPEKGRELLFAQGISGVRSELFFPYLNTFAQSNDIAISLARIKVKTSDMQPSGVPFAPKLYLLDFEIDRASGDTLETLNSDYTFSTSRHGGELSEDETEYVFDVTRQIQKIIESAQSGGNANLGFTLNAQVPVLNGNVAFQSVLQGSDNIVLEIFYTDINE
jgi:hypothetical protein